MPRFAQVVSLVATLIIGLLSYYTCRWVAFLCAICFGRHSSAGCHFSAHVALHPSAARSLAAPPPPPPPPPPRAPRRPPAVQPDRQDRRTQHRVLRLRRLRGRSLRGLQRERDDRQTRPGCLAARLSRDALRCLLLVSLHHPWQRNRDHGRAGILHSVLVPPLGVGGGLGVCLGTAHVPEGPDTDTALRHRCAVVPSGDGGNSDTERIRGGLARP